MESVGSEAGTPTSAHSYLFWLVCLSPTRGTVFLHIPSLWIINNNIKISHCSAQRQKYLKRKIIPKWSETKKKKIICSLMLLHIVYSLMFLVYEKFILSWIFSFYLVGFIFHTTTFQNIQNCLLLSLTLQNKTNRKLWHLVDRLTLWERRKISRQLDILVLLCWFHFSY